MSSASKNCRSRSRWGHFQETVLPARICYIAVERYLGNEAMNVKKAIRGEIKDLAETKYK